MTDVFWVSLLWVALSVVGIGISFLSIIEAIADREALRRSGKNGVRLIVARAALGTEYLRTAIQGILLVVGIGSALTPEIPVSREPLSYLMTVAVALIVVNSSSNLAVRRAVIRGTSSAIVKVAEQETLLEVKEDVERVSQKVAEVKTAADAAYEEANEVNSKIASISKRVGVVEERDEARA